MSNHSAAIISPEELDFMRKAGTSFAPSSPYPVIAAAAEIGRLKGIIRALRDTIIEHKIQMPDDPDCWRPIGR